MNIIIDLDTNPKEIGWDEYTNLLDKCVLELKKIYPKSIIFQSPFEIKNAIGKTVIVKDDFSFGVGAHLKKISRDLINLLFCSTRQNITCILLEPNLQRDKLIEMSSYIKLRGMPPFLRLQTILEQFKDIPKSEWEGYYYFLHTK